MKMTSGARVTTITGPTAEMREMLKDALQGAAWWNRSVESENAKKVTMDRCLLYETRLREMVQAEEQRIRDLQDRGI